MSQSEFQPTACNLCYANCGVLAKVEDGHIVKVRAIKRIRSPRGIPATKPRASTFTRTARTDSRHRFAKKRTAPLRKLTGIPPLQRLPLVT